MKQEPVIIDYYADILCVWAYVSQIRVDELQQEFGNQVQFKYHFFSLFGDTEQRIGQGWKDKDGFDGFHRHVLEIANQHEHLSISDKIWTPECRPSSSALPHLVIQAVQTLVDTGEIAVSDKIVEKLIGLTRRAFFEQGINIADLDIMIDLAKQAGAATSLVRGQLDNGQALALQTSQNDARLNNHIQGSPTFVLDGGRQKLFGNVGYRIIQANVAELLERHHVYMSWC